MFVFVFVFSFIDVSHDAAVDFDEWSESSWYRSRYPRFDPSVALEVRLGACCRRLRIVYVSCRIYSDPCVTSLADMLHLRR